MRVLVCSMLLSFLLPPAVQADEDGEVPAELRRQIEELNGRITALEERLDRLASRGGAPVALDGNGQVIGRLVDTTYAQRTISILTSQGYASLVASKTGRVTNSTAIWFDGPACQGNAYTRDDETPGTVWNNLDSGSSLWYVPRNAQYADAVALSRRPIGDAAIESCESIPLTVLLSVPTILPNNPAVTGFPDAGFIPRITIR